ncbi:hypothetical protein ACTTAI_08215 [Rhodobacter capsulatus]|uniref:hypothetical protein n=1 Tax=Rhodobacter capsulatus TaxID=1061 RepID=UPI004028F63C
MMVDLGSANAAGLKATSLSDMAKTEADDGVIPARFDKVLLEIVNLTRDRNVLVEDLREDDGMPSEPKICPPCGRCGR